ncbi:hypothetical protein WJ04_01520 [Burkholderia vietnamiensis]|nr:hypothetical protein WJ04_01520 [Burkholderia vietnamiensis]
MKCADHLAVRLFELRRVDELALLLRQRQQLDLAVDALGHRPLGDEIDTGLARTTGGGLAQVPDIGNTNLVERCCAIVNIETINEARHRRALQIEMVSNLLLSQHVNVPPYGCSPVEKKHGCEPPHV